MQTLGLLGSTIAFVEYGAALTDAGERGTILGVAFDAGTYVLLVMLTDGSLVEVTLPGIGDDYEERCARIVPTPPAQAGPYRTETSTPETSP